ncbi:hypothetical protein [Niabella hibiscisoli]|uniref:hypothetical protein n=1 Tax=Niabella hibiscisoli TaxID=1825928 RepID=UPI001F10D904|nr:hypothetical protein [Niabella hibiscisoli]MCH5718557.1 hypothetical protein [Niabella hibiscisoli]
MQQDIIKVAHSDQFQVRNPKDFTKIDFNLKEIDGLDFMTTNDKYLVVFCEINRDSLSGYFKKTLGLLSLYSTIYFTSNAEVAKFVNDRGFLH